MKFLAICFLFFLVGCNIQQESADTDGCFCITDTPYVSPTLHDIFKDATKFAITSPTPRPTSTTVVFRQPTQTPYYIVITPTVEDFNTQRTPIGTAPPNNNTNPKNELQFGDIAIQSNVISGQNVRLLPSTLGQVVGALRYGDQTRTTFDFMCSTVGSYTWVKIVYQNQEAWTVWYVNMNQRWLTSPTHPLFSSETCSQESP